VENQKKKLRRISDEDRRAYRARLGSDDAGRRLPKVETAEGVWDLVAKPLGIVLDDATLVAKQALVVVLDTVIAAGRHSTGDLFHRVFDALAGRWSLSFQDAGARGAFTIYNTSELTVQPSYRELLLAGVPLEDLWRHAVTKWVKTDGENPFYDIRRVPFGSYQVTLSEDPAKRDDFLKIARSDEQYRRELRGFRLLLNEDPRPEREPQREVAAEWSFNEVALGEKSEELLRRQEDTRLIFNITLFRHDCECMVEGANAIARDLWEQYEIDATLDHNCRQRRGTLVWSERHKNVFTAIPTEGDDYKGRRRGVWVQLARYDRLRSLLDNFDEVYARTSLITWGHLHAVEPGEEWGIGGILFHQRVIKSGFHRDINRRYAPSHFWPTHVPKTYYRSRWFRVETPVPELAVTDPRFKIYGPPLFELVDRDINSSMTQILAVLLDIPDLEEKARSTTPKFNHYLANEALRIHRESGDLLADGYDGEDGYKRLVEFVKALWMRTLYGSAAREVVYNLATEVDDYGLGWKTKAGLWEDGWLEEATKKAHAFLTSFPWYATVERYLHACQHLGDIALKKSRFRGVDVTDPSDGAPVRWNPVHRASKRVPVGSHYLYPNLPGRTVTIQSKKVFQPAQRDPITGDYAVDRGKLKRQIAPMMVHMLDAYFSSLVIAGLTKAGIRDVVGINDAWHVPALFQAKNRGPVISGQATLDTVILEAGAPWLKGLGSIYQDFIGYLGDTEDGKWFQNLEAKWRDRKERSDWPAFATH
jgi:hypothetical protein